MHSSLLSSLRSIAIQTPLILLDAEFHAINFNLHRNMIKDLEVEAVMSMDDLAIRYPSLSGVLKLNIINYLLHYPDTDIQKNKQIFKFLALHVGLREALFFQTRHLNYEVDYQLILKDHLYAVSQYFYPNPISFQIEEDLSLVKRILSQLDRTIILLSKKMPGVDSCAVLLAITNLLIVGFIETLIFVLLERIEKKLRLKNPLYD